MRRQKEILTALGGRYQLAAAKSPGSSMQGGFSNLILVEPKGSGKNGKRCVIKIPDAPSGRELPKGIEQLKNEIAILADLQHENIVSVVESVEDPYALVLPHYALGDLLDYVFKDPKKPPSPVDQYAIALGVIRGIAYIHDGGLLHRDIKPENVLLQNGSDGSLRPVLADFGFAWKVQDVAELTKIDTAGTAIYMPPEVISSQSYGGSDVWSFAVMCYVMATRELPGYAYAYDRKNVLPDPRILLRVSSGHTPNCKRFPPLLVDFFRSIFVSILGPEMSTKPRPTAQECVTFFERGGSQLFGAAPDIAPKPEKRMVALVTEV